MTSLPTTSLANDQAAGVEIVGRRSCIGIADLFEGDKIRAINTRKSFIAEFGNETVPLTDSYDDAIGLPQVVEQLRRRERPSLALDVARPSIEANQISIREYFNFQDKNPGNRHTRINFPAADAMKRCFNIPPVCAARQAEDDEVLDAFLIGNAGSFSQLHFDKDGRNGLLYQVYGRKRVLVFPYEASKKLLPHRNFSLWFVQNLSEPDRNRFLHYTGGKEILLSPGDAVFLPAYYWHYVDYIDDCCSINLRFRRSAPLAWLAEHFEPDINVQRIGRLFTDPSDDNRTWERAKAKFNSLNVNQEEITQTERREFIEELYKEVYPAEEGESYFVSVSSFITKNMKEVKRRGSL